MTNPFYVRAFDVMPGSSNRSQAVEDEFLAVQAGFNAVDARFADIDPYNAELIAARQGQASLLLNLGRYVSTFAAAAGNVNMGGFRVTNAGPASAGSDLATLAQVENLCNDAAGSAGQFAANAAASATLAASNAGSPVWVSGQAYTVGMVRTSPINWQAYRCVSSTSELVDPSESANWRPADDARLTAASLFFASF